jgi:hypothetical protein
MYKLISGWSLVLIVALALLGWLLTAAAQTGADRKVAEAEAKKIEPKGVEASRSPEGLPDLLSTSSVSFQQDGREVRAVGIHPQLKSSPNYIKGLRFSRMLGALAERETPVEKDLPRVIDGIRRNPDGSVWLRFRVMVTTPDFRKRCRDAVLAEERELLAEERLTQDDIRIEPWPLKHCVITAQDAFSKEIIAVSQTGTLTGTRQEFSFTMSYSPQELDKVLRLIRSGELEFVYTYSYVGASEHVGRVDLKGVKHAKLIASQKLRSEQVEGKEPIFQAEANEAVRHLYVSVEITMRATHRDLIALLSQSNLFHKLFTDDGQITLKDLKEGDEKTALQLAAYLKPHLEQIREAFGGEKSGITIHEDKVGEGTKSESGVQAGIGLPLPLPIPLSLSFGGGDSSSTTKTKEVIDRVEQVTGSKWAYDKATERWRPHSIKKCKFQSGADQVLIDEKTTVFLSVGAENRYLEDTPIPVTFTTKAAGVKSFVAGGSSGLGPYEGVPLGSGGPFFGAKPPKGFVFVEPPNRFPNADWVPVHLRGALMPDMRGQLLGGAPDEASVGLVKPGGKLVVQGTTIDGRNFSIPGKDRQSVRVGDGYLLSLNVIKNWGDTKQPEGTECGPIGQPKIHNNVNGRPAWTTEWYPVPATNLTPAFDKSLAGTQEIPPQTLSLNSASTNPRHVMCRWIIRVE